MFNIQKKSTLLKIAITSLFLLASNSSQASDSAWGSPERIQKYLNDYNSKFPEAVKAHYKVSDSDVNISYKSFGEGKYSNKRKSRF